MHQKRFFTAGFLGLFLLSAIQMTAQNVSKLEQSLRLIPGVTRVERIESTQFAEKYVFMIRQQVVPGNPTAGFFDQRVFLMHAGFDRPTVIVTEGYEASYGSRPAYREEVSQLFNTNIVLVEHRFFARSVPQPRQWMNLRGDYAMADLHRIRESFRTIYPGKWIATGISKGGQTALMYRTYYPEDVDITVAYVGPLCRGVEDGRHESFIANRVGTPEDRAKVLAFQKDFLSRRERLQPLFDAFCDSAKLAFRLPKDEIYDFCALEYSFAFWQWGRPVSSIPGAEAPDSVVLNHLIKVVGPDYFVQDTPTMPFFVQAAKELGYYGYDTKPFSKLLHIKSAKHYLKKLFLPDFYKPRFSAKLYKKMSDFIAHTDKNIMLLYGEWDPWTAAAVPDPHRSNIKYIVQPGGSHRTRIGTLPEEMKRDALQTLTQWLQ